MSVLRLLTPAETARVRAARDAIANASRSSVPAGAFNFFAAFDGTGNNRALVKAGALGTNVDELQSQAKTQSDDTATAAPNRQSRYYNGVGTGVGTGGDQGNMWVNGTIRPDRPIEAAARVALSEFAVAADKWLRDNPGKTVADLTASTVGFSRGCATAVVFAQLIEKEGLKLPDGTVVAPPGSVTYYKSHRARKPRYVQYPWQSLLSIFTDSAGSQRTNAQAPATAQRRLRSNKTRRSSGRAAHAQVSRATHAPSRPRHGHPHPGYPVQPPCSVHAVHPLQ